jgi:hypothetical protein
MCIIVYMLYINLQLFEYAVGTDFCLPVSE